MNFADFDTQMIIRLLAASIFGALIGVEREIHGRPAGFRTHLLVSLGSALFVVVSIGFYEAFNHGSGNVDPSRLAAQVVTGVGFLGAGAIIREQMSVRGLTTAACLWVASSIGVACGLGLFLLSAVVTTIALASLIILKKVEGMLSRDTYFILSVKSDNKQGQLEHLKKILTDSGLKVTLHTMKCYLPNNLVEYKFQIKKRGKAMTVDAINLVSEVSGIQEVSIQLNTSA